MKLKYENNERYIWNIGVMVGILILQIHSCSYIFMTGKLTNVIFFCYFYSDVGPATTEGLLTIMVK